MGKGLLPAGQLRLPEWLILPHDDRGNGAFDFIRNHLGLVAFTRAIAAGIEWCLDVTGALREGRTRWPQFVPIPWPVALVSMTMLGTRWAAGGGWHWNVGPSSFPAP